MGSDECVVVVRLSLIASSGIIQASEAVTRCRRNKPELTNLLAAKSLYRSIEVSLCHLSLAVQ